jgi:ankyrin repeat protein
MKRSIISAAARRRRWVSTVITLSVVSLLVFGFRLCGLDWLLDAYAPIGTADGVHRILLLGADPNCPAFRGEPLVNAAYNGNLPVVRALLSAGADPNAPGTADETAISWAALKGHSEVVKALLAAGADPNITPEFDPELRKIGKPDIIRMLRRAGAKL